MDGHERDPGSPGSPVDVVAEFGRDDSGIRDRLRELSSLQQNFERAFANRLQVDALGMGVMDHLSLAGTATPTELARRLEVSTAQMTLVLNRLQARGHVTRRPHPSDRRKIVVQASVESQDRAVSLVRPVIDALSEIIDRMDRGDRETVARFLDELIRVYVEATRSDP